MIHWTQCRNRSDIGGSTTSTCAACDCMKFICGAPFLEQMHLLIEVHAWNEWRKVLRKGVKVNLVSKWQYYIWKCVAFFPSIEVCFNSKPLSGSFCTDWTFYGKRGIIAELSSPATVMFITSFVGVSVQNNCLKVCVLQGNRVRESSFHWL